MPNKGETMSWILRQFMLACALCLTLTTTAHGEPNRAQVFQEGDWTGHLVLQGSPSKPLRCTITKQTDTTTFTFIRRLDKGDPCIRVEFAPERAQDLLNFTMLVDGALIRGPASIDEEKGEVEKCIGPWYDHQITQRQLKMFRQGDQVAFNDKAVDLPDLSLAGAKQALKRLDQCAQWRP